MINEAKEVNGRFELGLLLRDERDGVLGAGVTAGTEALERALDLINQLPVTDRPPGLPTTFLRRSLNSDGHLRRPQDRLYFFPLRPSPQERGRHSPRFDKPSVPGWSMRGPKDSLSLRERARVRGNVTSDHQPVSCLPATPLEVQAQGHRYGRISKFPFDRPEARKFS